MDFGEEGLARLEDIDEKSENFVRGICAAFKVFATDAVFVCRLKIQQPIGPAIV